MDELEFTANVLADIYEVDTEHGSPSPEMQEKLADVFETAPIQSREKLFKMFIFELEARGLNYKLEDFITNEDTLT